MDEDETEVGYYEGESLELAEVVREQILLWLPMRWICQEDCRGICSQCGANLNLEDCGCREELADDRWEALRSMRS